MKYIINHSHNPAYNIALEAYAFRELLEEDELFILWINEPTIVIGKHQNAIEEINKAYTDEHGIHVVRRLSGGGAVYHDLNNLNYTIISNKSQEGAFDFIILQPTSLKESFFNVRIFLATYKYFLVLIYFIPFLPFHHSCIPPYFLL